VETHDTSEVQVSPQTAEFSAALPADAQNLAVLRRFLNHTLVLCDSGANEADAAIVLSELTSNALEHGGVDTLFVRLRITPQRLTIEVADGSTAEPQTSPGAWTETGRGLRIVDRLAAAWGWDRVDAGYKTVWATMAAEPRR
jgi:anti-sigma regulatory factor (Ser/Thr protein kinase)